MSHFKLDEFKCKCGCDGNLISPNLVEVLEAIREDVEFPMVVTSGYRCKLHNTKVGGHKNSSHCLGLAADISCHHFLAGLIIASAIKHGIKGIGISQQGDWGQRFIHLDIGHTEFALWSY